jgi:hypothetical protein
MCHGWLRYDGASTPAQDQPLGSVHDQYAPGELPAAFRAVVRQGMQHLPRPEELPGGAEGLRIEVFLPMSLLLTLPVDQWRVDFSGRRGMRAGIRHQVVVRSLERAQPGHNVGARADWSAKWQHLGGRWREAVCDALSWLPPPPEADPDILSVKLLSARVVAVGQPWCPGGDPAAPALLVKLGAAPEDPDLLATLSGLPEDPDLLDVLDSVFSAGVPVALAVRLDDEPPADARAALLASLQEATLAELPETVLAQRREAVGNTSHFGGRLTLLWDDPGRPPPTITYTSGE